MSEPKSVAENTSVESQLEELKNLTTANLAILQELQSAVIKVNNWITWQKIFGVLKVIFIVIPLIVAGIYLPTLISNMVQPYQQMLQY